ncbi:MAG TPA: ABC transporter ATP-binding protein [Anaerovoracaceae bacterium]|nr:ABC transporter ATP-binding protein [Anaerovoracaceae bacterium]
MDYCITTDRLTKRYGQEVSVNRIGLAVPISTVYGFLGPNGAGKTTTMKMLLGLVHPTEGDICVLGQDVNEKNRLSILRNVGSLIDSPSYYGHLTARENLEIVRSLRGLPKGEIDAALDTVRLTGAGNKQASKFSLGMKQRLGIAAALMGRPKLMILDEPTNGLDPAGIQEMRELIKSFPAQYGMTVMVSSHLLSEIDQIADHVGIIRKGELVFQDMLASLHAKSRRHLALRTSDNERAAALLPNAKDTDGWLTLPQLTDEQAAEASLLLAQNGVGIVRMEQREKSLEDIFLEMTGTEAAL